MTMITERDPADYLLMARRRLDQAADCQSAIQGKTYDAVFAELADLAMLVWSAGIDLLSALMRLDGYARLGDSNARRRFLYERLAARHPQMELQNRWPYLAQLHGFQHNADLSETRFRAACFEIAELFGALNALLPEPLRLPAASYAWLAASL